MFGHPWGRHIVRVSRLGPLQESKHLSSPLLTCGQRTGTIGVPREPSTLGVFGAEGLRLVSSPLSYAAD